MTILGLRLRAPWLIPQVEVNCPNRKLRLQRGKGDNVDAEGADHGPSCPDDLGNRNGDVQGR